MKGDALPPPDHVARHCEKRFLFEGEEIGPGNFQLQGHTYVSVGWLEKYGSGSIKEKLAMLRKYWAALSIRNVKKKDKFGVLNVGHAIDVVQRKSVPVGRVLRILHEPMTTPKDDGHSGIFDTADDNQINLILAEACTPFPGRLD